MLSTLSWQDDPVVRVRPTEGRKRLPQYYQEFASADDVRIEIPADATLCGRDVVPVTEQFVGIGNAHSGALLSALFARRKNLQILLHTTICRNTPAAPRVLAVQVR